jgi:hypothetical protein
MIIALIFQIVTTFSKAQLGVFVRHCFLIEPLEIHQFSSIISTQIERVHFKT